MNKKCAKEFGGTSKSQHTRTLCTPLFDVTYKFCEDERRKNFGIVQCHKDKHAVPDTSASHRQNLLHRVQMVSSKQEKENHCSLNKNNSSRQFPLIESEFLMAEEISEVSTNARAEDTTKGIY